MPNLKGAFHKREKNIANIVARHELLIALISAPKKISFEVRSAINSQGDFAVLSIRSTKIQRLSLNTIKSIANSLFFDKSEGTSGYEYFDGLRIQLKELMKDSAQKNTNQTASENVKNELNRLKDRLKKTEILNLHRSNAYLDLYKNVSYIISNDYIDDLSRARICNLLEIHRSVFWHLFSPTFSVAPRELHVVQKNDK